jgi:transposase
MLAWEPDLQSEDEPRYNSFQVISGSVSRLEASPDVPRRRWSVEAKTRILAEALAPGANISGVARAHGLRPQQIFSWRRQALRSGLISPLGMAEEEPAFVAVTVERPIAIELVVKDVTIRVGTETSAARVMEMIRAARLA